MKYYACDFETTSYDGQESTEVWSSAFCEVGCDSEDGVIVHNNIEDTFKYFSSRKEKSILYYHNLKFDGEFWLWWLMEWAGYKAAIEGGKWLKVREMDRGTFTACISDMGLFYFIIIKTREGVIIELRDSLKLLPFSLKKIGDDFKLKHKKLEMEYVGERHAGGRISQEEMAYIKNDVLVLSEALALCFRNNMTKLTIGACCLDEYKYIIGGSSNFKSYFPDLGESIVAGLSGDNYIRKAYHGGYCYVVKGEEGKLQKSGYTLDVNSLYPSVMHSGSGNYYPVGRPHWWVGDIPKEALKFNRYFYVRFRCRFKLMPGMLPTIQIKGDQKYRSTQWLETSDIYNSKTGKYSEYYKSKDGEILKAIPQITMSCTDWALFNDHYTVTDLQVLDGCWFETEIGMFDEYIDKWAKIKQNSTGAQRAEAKLFLNNLYGKLASGSVSSFKVPYIAEGGSVQYEYHYAEDREPAYIPVGAAITSYARDFTIRHAQKNYHGQGCDGFKYADTDSLHIVGSPKDMVDIKLHDTAFNAWKMESKWEEAVFIRQKTYIEKVGEEYEITCAGMSRHSKQILALCLSGKEYNQSEYTKEEVNFIEKHRGLTLSDIKTGLEVPGKLRPTHIRGGVVLQNTPFTIR